MSSYNVNFNSYILFTAELINKLSGIRIVLVLKKHQVNKIYTWKWNFISNSASIYKYLTITWMLFWLISAHIKQNMIHSSDITFPQSLLPPSSQYSIPIFLMGILKGKRILVLSNTYTSENVFTFYIHRIFKNHCVKTCLLYDAN